MMSDVPAVTEQTLGDLMVELWRAKRFILEGLIVGLIVAALFIYAALPHYRASMILSPASPMGALSSSSSSDKESVSGVSALNEGAMFTRFEAMYKGVSVAGLLLRNEQVLDGLKRDRGFVFSDVDEQWNASKLAEYIAQRVVVDPVGETHLRQFYYDHIDPDFAAFFVQQIHETTDGLIRYEMRRDVNERIEYLQEAMGGVRNPEHRRGLTDLLMEQERLKMLVSINQAYAASVVEPSAAFSRVYWPHKSLIVAVFGFAGMLIGFVVFSAWYGGRKSDMQNVSGQASSVSEVQHVPIAPGPSDESRDLAARSRRKMQDWIRRDSGNENQKISPSQKKSSAAE